MNYCKFCGLNKRILDSGVDVEFYLDGIQTYWCGLCREGSKEYFQDFDTENIVPLIELTEETIESFEDLADTPSNRTKKMWLTNEIWRAKRELVWRVIEDV